YFESMGGKEKIKALQSRKMEATMSMGGMEFSGTIIEKAPNKQRVDVDIQGMQLVQAYDGETAWTINPFATGTEPQKMPEAEAEQMVKQKFEDPFIDYASKGHTVELEGKEEVEGAECFKLKLTKDNGDVEYHFFDAEYFIPVMSRTTQTSGPAAGMPAETFLSDYQEVNGIMFPFFLETKVNGQTAQKITLTSVELDVDVDDAFFAFPGAKNKMKEAEKEQMLKNAPKGEMKSGDEMEKTKAKKKKNN
ncbi:MAG: hypothetical protein R3330_03520, partial [Saprospiraceae bacterium]|nr:hypothetical protein [Saprospiraceae bacterium]